MRKGSTQKRCFLLKPKADGFWNNSFVLIFLTRFDEEWLILAFFFGDFLSIDLGVIIQIFAM